MVLNYLCRGKFWDEKHKVEKVSKERGGAVDEISCKHSGLLCFSFSPMGLHWHVVTLYAIISLPLPECICTKTFSQALTFSYRI